MANKLKNPTETGTNGLSKYDDLIIQLIRKKLRFEGIEEQLTQNTENVIRLIERREKILFS